MPRTHRSAASTAAANSIGQQQQQKQQPSMNDHLNPAHHHHNNNHPTRSYSRTLLNHHQQQQNPVSNSQHHHGQRPSARARLTTSSTGPSTTIHHPHRSSNHHHQSSSSSSTSSSSYGHHHHQTATAQPPIQSNSRISYPASMAMAAAGAGANNPAGYNVMLSTSANNLFQYVAVDRPMYSMPSLAEFGLPGGGGCGPQSVPPLSQNLKTYSSVRFIKHNSYEEVKTLVRPRCITDISPCIFKSALTTSTLHMDDHFKVFLRFCKFSEQTSEQMDCLPKSFILSINDSTFTIKNKYTFAPYDITSRIMYEKSSDIMIRVAIPEQTEFSADYYFGVFLMKKLDHKNMLKVFKQKTVQDVKISIDLVKRKLQNEDDEVIVDNVIKVSLLCPLSSVRITTPTRSKQCEHVHCFDAKSFISVNEITPRWKCPICKIYIKFEDLIIDGLFDRILKNAPDDCTEAQIFPDGSFDYLTEAPSDHKKSSSKTSHNSSSSPASKRPSSESVSAITPMLIEAKKLKFETGGSVTTVSKPNIECITIDDSDDDEGNKSNHDEDSVPSPSSSDTIISQTDYTNMTGINGETNETSATEEEDNADKDDSNDDEIQIVFEKIKQPESNSNNNRKRNAASKASNYLNSGGGGTTAKSSATSLLNNLMVANSQITNRLNTYPSGQQQQSMYSTVPASQTGSGATNRYPNVTITPQNYSGQIKSNHQTSINTNKQPLTALMSPITPEPSPRDQRTTNAMYAAAAKQLSLISSGGAVAVASSVRNVSGSQDNHPQQQHHSHHSYPPQQPSRVINCTSLQQMNNRLNNLLSQNSHIYPSSSSAATAGTDYSNNHHQSVQYSNHRVMNGHYQVGSGGGGGGRTTNNSMASGLFGLFESDSGNKNSNSNSGKQIAGGNNSYICSTSAATTADNIYSSHHHNSATTRISGTASHHQQHHQTQQHPSLTSYQQQPQHMKTTDQTAASLFGPTQRTGTSPTNNLHPDDLQIDPSVAAAAAVAAAADYWLFPENLANASNSSNSGGGGGGNPNLMPSISELNPYLRQSLETSSSGYSLLQSRQPLP